MLEWSCYVCYFGFASQIHYVTLCLWRRKEGLKCHFPMIWVPKIHKFSWWPLMETWNQTKLPAKTFCKLDRSAWRLKNDNFHAWDCVSWYSWWGKIGSYLGKKGSRLAETPQKKPHFMDAAYLTRKNLKIYNSTTTNATLMRLTKIMNHLLYYLPRHKTFNLAEDWGVSSQGIRECNWKTSQNEPENQFYGLILTILILAKDYILSEDCSKIWRKLTCTF